MFHSREGDSLEQSLFFLFTCCSYLPWSSGGSVFDLFGEDEWCVVFVVGSVVVAGLSRVCPIGVGLVDVVVVIVIVGLVGWSSLLFTKSLSMESHFKPSILCRGEPGRVVREIDVVSGALEGSRDALMSSSHILAGFPCLPYLFCLVDTAGFHFEVSFFQRSSWCSAIILACFQCILLCLRVHDVISLAAIRSSALLVARAMQST